MTERWTIPEDRKPLTRKQIAELFLRQQGRCPICTMRLETKGHEPVEFIDEHMDPLWRGGSNELNNRALVCKPCANAKTVKETSERAKGYRVRDRFIGAKKPRNPMPGSRNSKWKKRMDGTVVLR
jgi:5-methylcytosine-specific restriction endonuclease McrA